jgi:hypothetical protein
MAHHVKLAGGGTANWSVPVRTEEDRWRANFETFLLHRYTFDNGRHVHVKTRYAGVDDINGAGDVYAGWGSMEGVDEDGDWVHGKVDFEIVGDDAYGIYSFAHGTGKWEGVSGSVRAHVWAQPEKHDEKLPAPYPIRFWGFIDGEGDIDMPNFKP